MDRELQRALRAEGDDDPLRRAALCVRAGDLAAAAGWLRPALAAGAALPADLHDRLAPPRAEGGGFRALPGAGDRPLGPAVWLDPTTLAVAENDVASPRVLRWELDGAPAQLVELGGWSFTRGLVVDPQGARVALHARRFQRSSWSLYDGADGRRLAEASSPAPRNDTGRWQHAWWSEHVLCATDRGELWAWDLRRPPKPVNRWPELALQDGTIVARRKRELEFFASPYGAAARATIPLAHEDRLGSWSGLVATAGQRALVLDRAQSRLSLWSDRGALLGEAALPALEPLKLVAVRPCPAGTVAALRFKSQRRLLLVDLREGSHAWLEAPERPRDLVWSPDGQRLALPTRSGALLVWEAD